MTHETRDITGMEGDLETFPLLDMLFWLHQTERSAVMRVTTNGRPAWIFFRRGQLYRCEWRTLRGVPALFALVLAETGSFWLSKRLLIEGSANIDVPTEELLFKCAILIDEHGAESAA